jgi:hypothetical protein
MDANPELRPDPRTATADALIGSVNRNAMAARLPLVDEYRGQVVALRRLVRDLVAARDAGRQHPYREEEELTR